ncbi:four-carbon acid sugar kinase family protein [Fictibacillus sp. KIGAM418]|uniref:Four-carbon acid sugar kinase family protein n=1 Tax=Fictibacillus marinisediminis TaxID=2878389 RepID=A0A9X1XE04_9BACL|nr:four-carbon acid sugar kinase family protein [Fictibacillus marinisediminis]MCK6259132.1 four-carbon acid sugar kinase family protein [Fictibacillus marinisediminis]
MQLFILADDLTGANDSGVQLSKQGFRSTVWLENSTKPDSETDVAIYDTDSRALTEDEAYQRVYQASLHVKNLTDVHVYKKMDSTLRGNVGAELAAVSDAIEPEIVVISAAYPKLGRQTINGFQYVGGTLVDQTEFGQDPKTPVTESGIPALLTKYAEHKISTIDSQLLSRSRKEILANVLEDMDEGKKWFVCDAEKEEHLEKAAQIFASLNKRTLWAGSAGLIEYLPAALKLEVPKPLKKEKAVIRQTLTVSASLSMTTKIQLAKVSTMPDSLMIEMKPADLMKKTYDLQHLIQLINQAQGMRHLVLYVDGSDENRAAAHELGRDLGLHKNQVGEMISRELGIIARSLLDQFPEIAGLVLTGGDTAKAVCSEVGMTQMELWSELEPGLPLGILSDIQRSFLAVTKAGGFGNEDSLVHALNHMTGEVLEHESK